MKNLFGYGDIWDASGAYSWDQTSEVGIGVSLPRFKSISTPLMARASLSSQDWLKFSSYKERLLGLSFGLISTMQHDLSYNLTWRTLTDPSQVSSKSIRRQLGHNLLSALKYTYKIDQRNSHLRPTKGYAFLSTSQVGGLWDRKGLRFFRQVLSQLPVCFHNFDWVTLILLLLLFPQSMYDETAGRYTFRFVPNMTCSFFLLQEFDVRGAVPLGFYNSALNVGLGVGAILPLGRGFMNLSSSVPDRFYLGGHSSPVCSLSGLSSLLGFRTRGIGPTEPRRLVPSESEDGSAASPGRDYLGGDLAVSAFADLSFDLPLKIFRDAGIHGHAFLTAGNLAKLSEGEYKKFSLSEFGRTFRSSAGVGIILPTKLFRVEVPFYFIS